MKFAVQDLRYLVSDCQEELSAQGTVGERGKQKENEDEPRFPV